MPLLLPVGPRRMSSWSAHQLRNPKSTEPGTDFYCPIGTPIVAPADGTIYGWGDSIIPATGRWVGIDFDNGMSFRTMHHSKNLVTSGRVRAGQVYALSGASGYGEEDWSWNVAETGGAHVHATLWPTRSKRFGYDGDGRPFTVDLMQYVGGLAAGIDATPFDAEEAELMGAIDQIRDMFNATNQAIIERTQAQHDVTRSYLVDQSQRQHDVTRGYLGDLSQAQHDVTRGYLVDTITAAVAKLAVGVDAAEIRQAVTDAVAHIDVTATVDVDKIADAVNDEADQRARDRLNTPTA